VAFWRDFKKFNKEGIGYVESTEDPRDRRSKLLRLTPEGKKFYEQLRSKRHAQIAGKQLVS
ncbi:DNA-binding MarR family transcriptional regulator, partial [Rhodoblastus acidophilus]